MSLSTDRHLREWAANVESFPAGALMEQRLPGAPRPAAPDHRGRGSGGPIDRGTPGGHVANTPRTMAKTSPLRARWAPRTSVSDAVLARASAVLLWVLVVLAALGGLLAWV